MKNRINQFLIKVTKGKIRFSEKAYIFLLCLLLSTFFWFLSSLSDSYTTSLSANLKYNSLDEDFILTEEPPARIFFNVRSSGFELLGEQFSLDRKEVEVNLQNARASTTKNRYFILTKTIRPSIREQLDEDIELISLKSDTLFLSTEERHSKNVKVLPQTDLSFKSAYKLRGDIIVKPAEVEVFGPATFIDTLKVLRTKQLVQKNLSDSLQITVDVLVEEPVKGLRINPSQVELLLPVEKYTEKQITVPVEVNNQTEQSLFIRIFPDDITVTFLVPISMYNNLSPSRIEAVVDYNLENRENKKLKVEINNMPDYAILRSIEPEEVEYIIRK